eukprot:12263258-Alexandrium_andersonii.AAC.1
MVDSGRARFAGTAEELAAILAPHAVSPVFLRYEELPKRGSDAVAKVNPQVILKHKTLIRELMEAQPNISFARNLTEEAFRI